MTLKPVFIASLAVAATSAQAAVLVHYTMQGNAAQAVTPSSVDANITATNLAKHNGAAPTLNTYSTGQFSLWSTTVGASGSTFADAVTDGNFITFSITPVEGQQLTLTSLTFQAAAATSNTSDRAFFVVAEDSVSNFSSSSTVLLTDRTVNGTLAYQAATASATVASSYSIDLTSFAGAFENITATKYFRIYLQTPGGNQSIAFDNIIINGSSAPVSSIPEPASFAALAGLGALGLVASRRRRQG